MFLYSFGLHAGNDKVFIYKNLDPKFQTGDLIKNLDGFFLVLGEEISFPELFLTIYSGKSSFELIEKKLLSEKTMQLVHWMCYYRYATYKAVIKLFLDIEIEKLLQKKSTKKQKKTISNILFNKKIISTEKNQILLVFADLWSRENIITKSKNALSLNSQDTSSKKNTNWRNIKSGQETLIVATSSEIFQNYANLSNIYIFEPQKRYYAAQQDPRYKVSTVIQKLAEIHNAQLHYIPSEDLMPC